MKIIDLLKIKKKRQASGYRSAVVKGVEWVTVIDVLNFNLMV